MTPFRISRISPPPSPAPKPVLHRAGWVIADPGTLFQDGYVLVENGQIKAVGGGSFSGDFVVVDHGHGAIIPELVNAHTHLELGALRGKLPFDNGFQEWVSQLIQKRAELTDEDIIAGIRQGKTELLENGCGVVGEISTLGTSWEILSDGSLSGVWFMEYLGHAVPESLSCKAPIASIRGSLAGHAPHTSSPLLLATLKTITREKGLPFSIHVAESEAELAFLTTAKGDWADFLTHRQIDYSDWGLPVTSPVFHLDRIGILDHRTLAVHVLLATEKDLNLLARHKVSICVCPRSNQNLHGNVPDIPAMLRAGLTICLGTDSPASVSSLSLWEEMSLIACRFPSVSPADIWSMATLNGAAALGISDLFGRIVPGAVPSMLYVPVRASTASSVLEFLVFGDHS